MSYEWTDKLTGRRYETSSDPDACSKRQDGGPWEHPDDGFAVDRELLRLAEENWELQLTVACRDATLAMTVDRLGGEVEGAPTARINFLQRVDALRGAEEERDRLAQTNADLNAQKKHYSDLLSTAEAERDRLAEEVEHLKALVLSHAARCVETDRERDRALSDAVTTRVNRHAEVNAAAMMGWVEGADAAFKEMGVDAEEERFRAFYLDKNPHRPENARREIERLLGLPAKEMP